MILLIKYPVNQVKKQRIYDAIKRFPVAKKEISVVLEANKEITNILKEICEKNGATIEIIDTKNSILKKLLQVFTKVEGLSKLTEKDFEIIEEAEKLCHQ